MKRTVVAVFSALSSVIVALGIIAVEAPVAAAATCTDSLQAKIDAAPSGGTVSAGPCVYRESVTVTKPLTLNGQGLSEIRGSDVWTNWTKKSTGWVSSKTVPSFQARGECAPSSDRCLRPEQVFIDGQPLRQIGQGGTPGTGKFALDGSRRVVLGTDPRGKTVEVTVRSYWVRGGAGNVTINGFTMRHSANDAQTGALRNGGYSNWTVKNSGLFGAHGLNLKFEGGSNFDLLDTELAYAGQMGLGSYRVSDLEVRGVQVHHNNTEAFDRLWEAGGVKFTRTSNLRVEGGHWYENDGPGIWCDIHCNGATIANNRIHHNGESAIFYEISDDAKIFGNVIWENGWRYHGGAWEGAIRATNTRGVEIYNNTLAWNQSGISVLSTNRGDYPETNPVYNNQVHDNAILSKDYAYSHNYNSCQRPLALAYCQTQNFGLFDASSNNGGYGNDYYFASTPSESIPRYTWGERAYTSLTTWNTTPGENDGRYLTKGEKDALVANKGIPAAPEH